MRRALSLAAVAAAVTVAFTVAAERPAVSVAEGRLVGEALTGGGAVFKGIPYAQAPVGDLRWRAPQPPKAWVGPRDASRFGAICPQNPSAAVPQPAALSSEDCLFLNVWTPEWPAGRPRPVLLWFPGGGNVSGGTSEPRHAGEHLARRGIVVVTANYRLGSFGFYSHPALSRESPDGSSGNQGLRDQLAAVEWVRANVARFGGDPGALTLGGVSAGGIDIAALMTSPLAAGRFSRAILQSGPSRGALPGPLALADAEREGARHATAWGASPSASLAALRALTVAQILATQPRGPVAHLNLTVDGHVLQAPPADVFAEGREQRIALLTGNAARDFVPGRELPAGLEAPLDRQYGPMAALARPLYATVDPLHGTPEVQWATDTSFRCTTVLQAKQHAAAGNPVFAYEFARLATPEILPGGNIHGLDSGFSLGTFAIRAQGTQLAPVEFTAADAALSETMQRYWVNFVTSGDPNRPGLPVWPPFRDPERAYVQLAAGGAVVKEGLRRAQCDLYIESLRRPRPTLADPHRP
jgi:para-nitrobenzyl esterase